MTIKNLKYMAMSLLCMLLMAACGSDDTPYTDPDANKIDLQLTVAVANSSFQRITRAPFDDTTDGGFENPDVDNLGQSYELVKSLRVVIVRPTGVIEHNRVVTVAPELNGNVINGDLRFKVEAGEKKTIYLFANEETVSYDFDNLAVGTTFPTSDVADILLTRKPNAAFIDNTLTAQAGEDPEKVIRHYVPMSESFIVDVVMPQSSGDFFQTAHLFLMRSLIKFSFHIYTSADYTQSGTQITGIKLENLANEGYYLPRNTIYSPDKYSSEAVNASGISITSFDAPASATFSGFDFLVTPPYEIKQGLDATFDAKYYFPESKATPKLSLMVETTENGSSDLNNAWLEPIPLQLKEIPRNTHVKINIKVSSTGITPEVELLPYTGVFLDPDFGL